MKSKNENKNKFFLPVFLGIFSGLVFLNLVVLYYLQIQAKAIVTTRREQNILTKANEEMQKAVADYNRYKSRIESLKNIFPSEETFPDFINDLEALVKQHVSEYNFRFTSLTPLAEQDKSYLLINLNVKTDFNRLLALLDGIGTLPYMTHVLSLSAKSSQGFSGEAEVLIVFKIYVQKPFSSK